MVVITKDKYYKNQHYVKILLDRQTLFKKYKK